MDLGIDYAWGRPSPEVLVQQGYRFVSRYLCWQPNGKVIDAAELASLRAAGLEVMLNWEFYGDWEHDYARGAVAGREHALEAVRQAKALGYPTGCSIYFSVDFDCTEAQAPTVEAYNRAAGEVCHAAGYRMGAYGGYWTIKRLLDAGAIDDAWQTYAWSGGNWDGRAAVRQVQNGITVDGVDSDRDERHGQTFMMGGQGGAPGSEDEMDYIEEKATGTVYACPPGLVDGRRPAIPLTGDRWNGGLHRAGGGQLSKVDKLDPGVFVVLAINASWPPAGSGGGTVELDLDAIAKAVNDDAARRLVA